MSSSFFSSVMEFLSTPSARRATLTSSSQKTVQMIFLSTPSARRATLTLILTVDGHIISIHALREEGDLNCPLPSAGNKRFLSTPSARRATSAGHICTFTARFLSTPSARRATKLGEDGKLSGWDISIHALREEGDAGSSARPHPGTNFYPRPPRGGRHWDAYVTGGTNAFLSTPSARRATWDAYVTGGTNAFLSTPSARRATFSCPAIRLRRWNFYPRPPRGGRPACLLWLHSSTVISIHALREEGDGPSDRTKPTKKEFLSTPSARRATRCPALNVDRIEDFYPRPPRGGRPWMVEFGAMATIKFLSTPSARRATAVRAACGTMENISIHALREEGDV